MAPRKPTIEEQQAEFRETLENFTATLHDALQQAITSAVTTVLQNQHNQQRQPRDIHPDYDDDDDDALHENLFAVPVRQDEDRQIRPRNNNNDIVVNNNNVSKRWDSGFKLDIPEFSGTLKAEDFIDWLNIVEEVLDFKKVPDDGRVSLVATRFKGRAMAWWTQLKESRRNSRKSRIDSWEKMKKHMRRSFLPYNYQRTLYTKLQNLRQGSRTVDEYASDFFEMVARTTLLETEEQLVSRFLGGLRTQLQIPLQQFNPNSVSEAHQRALGMELQYKSNWNSSSSRTRFLSQTPTESSVSNNNDSTVSRPNLSKSNAPLDSIAASRQPRTSALRCYSCGESGHRQTACPNQTKRGLLVHDT